ncbi:hypothetical protein [Bradyrhizobium sp. dw_411]|uniref:hypothetical protein n=1 Tax=Bradyrhizobium sp. dw_411 TaxID=2720082 RepID=UPI001BCB3BDE|nr:hypothetical protein [Bradyrhizobium sp. dw_411]
MIAMPLTCPDISREQTSRHSPATTAQDSRPTGILPGGGVSTATAPFQPLDPGIINEAIPAFFIGRNSDGFWLAREARGKTGGIFLFERSALSFARRHSRAQGGCATIFPSERFELDLENQGSVLVAPLRRLMRLAAHTRQRIAAVISNIKRGFGAV